MHLARAAAAAALCLACALAAAAAQNAPPEPSPAAAAAASPKPEPVPVVGTPPCEPPDLSSYGPVTSLVTTDEDAYSEDHNQLISSRDYCLWELTLFKNWHHNFRSCYRNPTNPVWYLVDWSCLINNILKPVDPKDDLVQESPGGTQNLIKENDQYYYQCKKTCKYWTGGYWRP